ncbi:hypothetical protein EV1_039381 [Malus domestica]
MDHTFTLRWTMPSSVPFAARPFPNSNGVIFRRIHSVPVIRLALGSESCGQWENKKEALTPYGPMIASQKHQRVMETVCLDRSRRNLMRGQLEMMTSEDDDDDFEPPSGGIPYDGNSTKPEDIAEWVRMGLKLWRQNLIGRKFGFWNDYKTPLAGRCDEVGNKLLTGVTRWPQSLLFDKTESLFLFDARLLLGSDPMDSALTLFSIMPSSVPFAPRPSPNPNRVIFRCAHSVPVIRQRVLSVPVIRQRVLSIPVNRRVAATPYDSEAEASKSCGTRLPQSFQEELDERAARGDFVHHHLLGIDVPDKFKFKKEDKGKEQEAIPIEDVVAIEDDSEEAIIILGLPPSDGISYDGKSTKPEDIDEWLRTRFGYEI